MKETEVENFLQDLKVKLDIFGIWFWSHREKNKSTMLRLGFVVKNVVDHLKELKVEDYSSGPDGDTQNNGEYWIFGKEIQNLEIYIKINYGSPGAKVICISFHVTENKLTYPFKKKYKR